ncbi:hypothetical protein SACS_0247 [Parasaccharibacter apium]|uniref:Uncharacterized protein n=1 Tax=Parasaccharibacter apium TaxID=1510841 RepID=A0A7U7G4N3_9PROT|nr:hypothetical protein SACS_0247 [Parasaccharibacter apium]
MTGAGKSGFFDMAAILHRLPETDHLPHALPLYENGPAAG